ncbi:MAG: dioxygenase [Alphaproteobacteria bacterium]|nr:dioxygenase [Alphaproteobacteria bacterium]
MPERSIFLSHGAPSLILDDAPARRFLAGWGASLGRPRAVVVASAHWLTREPAVSAAPAPDTIHDFGGFDPKLYEMHYRAPGAPEVARRAADLLGAAGFAAGIDPQRGMDHGAWCPLTLIYPAADIPVVSMSVQPNRDPAHHLAVGRALAPLLAEDVLVIGSGSTTHDLRRFRRQPIDTPEAPDSRAFAEWLAQTLESGDVEALADVWRRGPHALANHPTPEHLLPFFVALGAGGGIGRRVHASATYGMLAMDAFAFGTSDGESRRSAA